MSLWGKTFGVCNIVYLMMYTTFVAAGVDVLLLRLGTPSIKAEASKRVQLSLAILEQASAQGPGESSHCPGPDHSGIRKGIAIIKAQLEATNQQDPGSSTGIAQTPSASSVSLATTIHPPANLFNGASGVWSDTSTIAQAPAFTSFATLEPSPTYDTNLFIPTSDLDFLASLNEPNLDTQDPFAFLTSEA